MSFVRYCLMIVSGPFGAGWRGLGTTLALGLIVILTLVTQVGGLVLWLCIGFTNGIRNVGRSGRPLLIAAIFSLAYGTAAFFIVPPLASIGGRVPLPCLTSADAPLQPNSLFFCLANRNYVVPALAKLSRDVSRDVAAKHPRTITSYLDAGFPFGLYFPLLPHLSHGDGRKVDFALFYKDGSGTPRDRGGAWGLGYFAFQPAEKISPMDQCQGGAGLLRWDVDFAQSWFDDLSLDLERNRSLVEVWVKAQSVERLFLEPKLAKAFGLNSPKIGFAGCAAARHDDHIHVQIK